MGYRFFPILLFVVEVGAIYGVSTAASAQVPKTDTIETEVIVPQEQARLLASPYGIGNDKSLDVLTGMSVTVEVAEVEERRERVPVKRISDEDKRAQAAAATTALSQVSAEEPLLVSDAKPARRSSRVRVAEVPVVPFYSQFSDISSPRWQKVGCGIASLAMLIDHYHGDVESVDSLLQRGIAANAFLSDAGWIHAGLIGLSAQYGLTGESVSLAHLSADSALQELETVLKDGPVMASVHYTFEPTNPIPHLVVINGVSDGLVHYNDPAESAGGGTLTIEKFQRAWKKRYIVIRPA